MGMKVSGDRPELRMIPAGQGFRLMTPAALEVELRLEMQRQLGADEVGDGEGLAQRVFHEEAPGRGLVHVGGKELVVVAAGVLGVVHGHVGVAQQGVGVAAVLGQKADADARRGVKIVPLDVVVDVGQIALDLAGDGGGRHGVFDIDQNDDEFVTPRRPRCRSPHAILQPARHLDEDTIADVVPQGIVDGLEAVQVDEQHRELALIPRAGRNGVLGWLSRAKRLGSSVRASWVARCAIRFEASRLSLMSVKVAT